ncbi:MAG TPA: transcription antitermination factor NusB [Patescibacteria group bacterium]|nr:transcription antitermination factor NusB [Patescibacteria group bacterium]
MKTASDPRHKLRRKVIKELFANEFHSQDSSETTKRILQNIDAIDLKITVAAPEWPISKINRVDLAVLQLAVWEIMDGKAPEKVIVDEAIELAKEYGSESSPGFVNGVLGTILKNGK